MPILVHLNTDSPAHPLRDARRSCRGLTLLELLVVLVILIALAGILTINLGFPPQLEVGGGERKSVQEIVTETTMRELRDALVGAAAGEPSFWQDLGALPERIGFLIRQPPATMAYDAQRRRGWRGPYLVDAGTRFGDFTTAGDGFSPALEPEKYGQPDDPAFLDAWGKPIVLQEPDTPMARLVSAGPNRILETDPDDAANPARGDDRVLFLFSADPLP